MGYTHFFDRKNQNIPKVRKNMPRIIIVRGSKLFSCARELSQPKCIFIPKNAAIKLGHKSKTLKRVNRRTVWFVLRAIIISFVSVRSFIVSRKLSRRFTSFFILSRESSIASLPVSSIKSVCLRVISSRTSKRGARRDLKLIIFFLMSWISEIWSFAKCSSEKMVDSIIRTRPWIAWSRPNIRITDISRSS